MTRSIKIIALLIVLCLANGATVVMDTFTEDGEDGEELVFEFLVDDLDLDEMRRMQDEMMRAIFGEGPNQQRQDEPRESFGMYS